jgi:hypothetical protein
MCANQVVPETTVGLDLGDRKSALCRLDALGEVVDRRVLPTQQGRLDRFADLHKGIPAFEERQRAWESALKDFTDPRV